MDLRPTKYTRPRLQPRAERFDSEGNHLPCIDDTCMVCEESEGSIVIEFAERTGHRCRVSREDFKFEKKAFRPDLPPDQQGVLNLSGYVWLRGVHAGFEQLLPREARSLAEEQSAEGVLPYGTLY
jgi:hypothetical protein